jgi:hypothetical protein
MVFRNTLVDPLVRSGQIVVNCVLLYHTADMKPMPDEHMIQTFPFQTADNPLADCIGLGRPNWGP